MSWFKRHLNWTLLISVVGGYAVAFGLSFPLYFISSLFSKPETSYKALVSVVWVLFLIFTTIVSGWILRKKGQSLWYLLMLILPLWLYFQEGTWALLLTPFGIIVYLALPSKIIQVL